MVYRAPLAKGRSLGKVAMAQAFKEFRPKKKSKYLEAAEKAYEKESDALNKYEVVKKTPTLTFYKHKTKKDKVLLGVRGTADKEDVVADAALSVGLLGASSRYKKDKAAVDAFLRENPGARIKTAGHSLGGAVARKLTRDFSKNIEGGKAYNSAIGLDELASAKKLRAGKQERFTTKNDFLRLLSKPFLKREDQAKVVDAGIKGLNPLTAHGTRNFDATGAGV